MYLLGMDSTGLDQVGYDPGAQVLLVVFRDRSAYCYSDVPRNIFDSLQAAPSKGVYFNRAIRGAFACERLRSEE